MTDLRSPKGLFRIVNRAGPGVFFECAGGLKGPKVSLGCGIKSVTCGSHFRYYRIYRITFQNGAAPVQSGDLPRFSP